MFHVGIYARVCTHLHYIQSFVVKSMYRNDICHSERLHKYACVQIRMLFKTFTASGFVFVDSIMWNMRWKRNADLILEIYIFQRWQSLNKFKNTMMHILLNNEDGIQNDILTRSLFLKYNKLLKYFIIRMVSIDYLLEENQVVKYQVDNFCCIFLSFKYKSFWIILH